jgi:hypothetical protein
VPHQDKPTRVPSPVWVCVCCVSVVCEHAQRCVTAECGARGPEVYVEHASAGLGRARVRIEKQRAPDGLGALLTNILRGVMLR